MDIDLRYITVLVVLISALITEKNPITVENLSHKWKLVKYTYMVFSEDPSENEKEDYILLHKDMTFESISEGVFDRGIWKLAKEEKKIYLSSEKEEGALIFIIHSLDKDKLIVKIDDPRDPDAKNLKIHFSNSGQ